MRLIRNIIFLTFIAAVLLFVYREPLLKKSVKWIVKDLTGFSVEVEKLRVGIFRPVIDIRELKIYNPESFSDRLLLDMPRLLVRYVPSEIFKGNLVFKEIRIDVEEFQLVKQRDGSTNIGQLKGVGESGKKTRVPALSIALLRLRINKLVYKDYTVSPPLVKTFHIGINKEFYNINDSTKLVRLIVGEALLKTNIRNLADVNIGILESTVKTVLGTSKELVTGTTSVAVGVVKGTINTTTGVLKKTAGEIGSIFSPKKE